MSDPYHHPEVAMMFWIIAAVVLIALLVIAWVSSGRARPGSAMDRRNHPGSATEDYGRAGQSMNDINRGGGSI